MLSEVMQKKLIGVARRWDVNGDGFVEEEDYAIAAERLASLSGFAPGSTEFIRIHQALMAGWDLMRQFDSDSDGRVSAEECLSGFERMYADPDTYDAVVVQPSKEIFDLVDSDHDGAISPQEHQAFLRALSATDEDIAVAWEHIDPSHDGAISRDHFVRLVDDFFRSDDPGVPGTWLFGRP
jgi:Ca2+-binding EF-hand superfamily protein